MRMISKRVDKVRRIQGIEGFKFREDNLSCPSKNKSFEKQIAAVRSQPFSVLEWPVMVFCFFMILGPDSINHFRTRGDFFSDMSSFLYGARN
ncbi:MAG: hypothetical protein PVF22_07070, partial [Candidatus Aminicenantes bacterium]